MAHKVRFINYQKQFKKMEAEIMGTIKEVLTNGDLMMRQQLESFETNLAAYVGTPAAVGLNSCTDGLHLSLKALGVGPGDEVITTPFTFIATAGVIANCGANSVFIDIEPKTFNIDPRKIEEYLKSNIQYPKSKTKIKAILPVHLFGQMADMSEIMRIAKKYKLFVIEDAAQAIGAEYKGKKAGAIGDLGCLSFFPSKNLGAYGDGGMVVTNNKKLSEKIRMMRNHGSSPKEKYLNLVLGTNSRLDSLQAAILRIKLKYLPKWSRERANKAFYYNNGLKGTGDIITPIIDSNKIHIFHQYTIRTKFRDELQKYLKENEIPTMIYYPLPLHLQPAFKYLGYKKGDFPEAEKAANLYVKVVPKKLDEEVAAEMVKGFGGVITKLTETQAKYINVPVEGPFKPEDYKY